MGLEYRLRELAAKVGVLALKSSGFFDGYWAHWRGPFFDYAEAKGLHILPVHYYSPVPRIGSVSPRTATGVPIDLDQNKAKLQNLLQKYDVELSELFENSRYDAMNGAFGALDAAALYCMLRDLKPKRIIEIGSGHSTLVTAAAIRTSQAEDRTYRPNFTCIEPFLPEYLQDTPAEVSEVVPAALQIVPLELFTSLTAGDLLFIDSTHVASFGSDVLYEYLTILPALAEGVVVHIHDVFLPHDYPERWLREHRFFWNEQYVLEALLLMNPSFRVELAVHAAAEQIERTPTILRHWSEVQPASFWISRA
jgi:predicted O-methyltransferase YrrM